MRKIGEPIRIATRGSALALSQARAIQSDLENHRFDVEIIEVETTGDSIRDELIHRLGKTGAFVRSLDEKVLDGTVDIAVHSLKDVPTDSPDELVVAAVPKRGQPNDVLITPDGSSINALGKGSVLGTASLRRRAQLLSERPDLVVKPIRGNIDTRIEKLLAPYVRREYHDQKKMNLDNESDADQNPSEAIEEWMSSLTEIERHALDREPDLEYDGIVLAVAGLERADLMKDVNGEVLPIESFIPAPGQGAIAVTMVDSDPAEEIHRILNHPRSRMEVTVERTILQRIGGGCIAPIGIYAVTQGGYVRAAVQVLSQSGDEVIAESRDLPIESYGESALEFANHLIDLGAQEIIQRAKRDLGS